MQKAALCAGTLQDRSTGTLRRPFISIWEFPLGMHLQRAKVKRLWRHPSPV